MLFEWKIVRELAEDGTDRRAKLLCLYDTLVGIQTGTRENSCGWITCAG